jgi:hypothetical protein
MRPTVFARNILLITSFRNTCSLQDNKIKRTLSEGGIPNSEFVTLHEGETRIYQVDSHETTTDAALAAATQVGQGVPNRSLAISHSGETAGATAMM